VKTKKYTTHIRKKKIKKKPYVSDKNIYQKKKNYHKNPQKIF